MPKAIPNRLPERGPFARLYAWLNQLRDYVESLRPVRSVNTLTNHTSIGVSRDGNPRGGVTQTSNDKPVWL